MKQRFPYLFAGWVHGPVHVLHTTSTINFVWWKNDSDCGWFVWAGGRGRIYKKSRSSVSAGGVFLNIPSFTSKQRNIHVTDNFVSTLQVDLEWSLPVKMPDLINPFRESAGPFKKLIKSRKLNNQPRSSKTQNRGNSKKNLCKLSKLF